MLDQLEFASIGEIMNDLVDGLKRKTVEKRIVVQLFDHKRVVSVDFQLFVDCGLDLYDDCVVHINLSSLKLWFHYTGIHNFVKEFL